MLGVKKLLWIIFNVSVFKKLDKNTFSFINQKNNLICVLVVISIFFFDRISKLKIINHQINNNSVYITDFINFDLVWNTGIGFGIFSSNSNLIYNLITSIIGVVIIFLIYLIVKSKFIDKLLFSLVLGGALGNFYDRLVFLAVPDFIDIHFQRFHWFTFNIADIFITLGVMLLIIKDLFLKNDKN